MRKPREAASELSVGHTNWLEADRFKAQGADGRVKSIVAKRQGHNYWEGFFRSRELLDFVIARARAGQQPKGKRTD